MKRNPYLKELKQKVRLNENKKKLINENSFTGNEKA